MQNQEVYDELMAKFEKLYGMKPAAVAYAPGRIEVLGNHTDYNEGFVFSAAIDKGTFFAVAPSEDTKCSLTAGDFMETVEFDDVAELLHGHVQLALRRRARQGGQGLEGHVPRQHPVGCRPLLVRRA